jgi:hypothetical protein
LKKEKDEAAAKELAAKKEQEDFDTKMKLKMAEQDKLEKEKWAKDKVDPAAKKTELVVAKKEDAKSEVAKPASTDVAKPPVTDATKPPVTDTTKPLVVDATKPLVTEVAKPLVTDVKKSTDPVKPAEAIKLPVKEEAKTELKKEVTPATKPATAPIVADKTKTVDQIKKESKALLDLSKTKTDVIPDKKIEDKKTDPKLDDKSKVVAPVKKEEVKNTKQDTVNDVMKTINAVQG